MLSRKEQTKAAILLPDEWRQKVEQVLTNAYEAQCKMHKKSFQVHGLTYPNELFVAVGLFDPDNLLEAPVSYLISVDIEENESTQNSKDYQKKLDTLIDSMGVFFDAYFADQDWNDYQANWTEAQYKDLKFHYKVSRENMSLTIQAEALLNQ